MFQSTRPTRGATLIEQPRLPKHLGVSIHAPHAGRDHSGFVLLLFNFGFQSTRPTRGATSIARHYYPIAMVSIHAPHAGRDFIHPNQ